MSFVLELSLKFSSVPISKFWHPNPSHQKWNLIKLKGTSFNTDNWHQDHINLSENKEIKEKSSKNKGSDSENCKIGFYTK